MSQSRKLTPNFCLPLDFTRLRNDKLSLVPFESDFEKFSKRYVQVSHEAPMAWRYLNYGPWATLSDFQSWYDRTIRANKEIMLFAIVLNECTIVKKRVVAPTAVDSNITSTVSNSLREGDRGTDAGDEEVIKVPQGTFAGVTGLCHTDPVNSVTEIGHILIFPQFQRTFVATTAHGLILQHLLNPSPLDLHFRRVQWQANSRNQASQRAAERLGFVYEGTMRWHRVLLEDKESELQSDRTLSLSSSLLHLSSDVEEHDGSGELKKTTAAGLPMTGPTGILLAGGRHGKLYGLCWDDWLDGGKSRIEKLMAR